MVVGFLLTLGARIGPSIFCLVVVVVVGRGCLGVGVGGSLTCCELLIVICLNLCELLDLCLDLCLSINPG